MNSGNPALSEKAFRNLARSYDQDVMTSEGAYTKTAILLAICIGAASFTMRPEGMAYIWPGIIGGFILALVTIFKKEWSPVTAPLYAVFEGVALGAISFMYEAQFPGIVTNAIFLTFSVMGIMLLVYRTGMIQVTPKLQKGIIVATGAICLVYLVNLVMMFFGKSIPMIHSAGPIGIGFSLVVVGIATFNLLLDFDFIEKKASEGSAPKYIEWYASFGLLVTLIWLYLELLRLLSKLNRR
jgi:uncharacterized YccA/Bax inhibitor family protein